MDSTEPIKLQCKRSIDSIKSIRFSLLLHFYTLNYHSLSIGAIYFRPGLPDFKGMSPAGLRADFYEFSKLVSIDTDTY